jgi:hypothetical protein
VVFGRVSLMLAADASPSQPWWLVIAGIAGTIAVAYIAAKSPVWVERIKTRREPPAPTPAQKVASAEDVLRAWLKATIRERDKALKEVERLERRIQSLERELIRMGWDGRTA